MGDVQLKGKFINKSTLRSYLNLSVENSKLLNSGFVEAISKILKDHHNGTSLSKDTLNSLLKVSIEDQESRPQRITPEFLVSVYDMEQNKSNKREIKNAIQQILSNNYDPQLFYTASLFDVIAAKGIFFQKYIDYAQSSTNSRSIESAVTGVEDKRFPEVGALLNLCFKYDINTDSHEFEKFKDLGDYYIWLLNMDAFDYNLFEPLWATEYQTKFYFEKIQKYPIIKEKIASYVKENQNPKLEHFYIKLIYK